MRLFAGARVGTDGASEVVAAEAALLANGARELWSTDFSVTGSGVTGSGVGVGLQAAIALSSGIVGARAGELIGLWALAISSRLKISQVAGMVAHHQLVEILCFQVLVA